MSRVKQTVNYWWYCGGIEGRLPAYEAISETATTHSLLYENVDRYRDRETGRERERVLIQRSSASLSHSTQALYVISSIHPDSCARPAHLSSVPTPPAAERGGQNREGRRERRGRVTWPPIDRSRTGDDDDDDKEVGWRADGVAPPADAHRQTPRSLICIQLCREVVTSADLHTAGARPPAGGNQWGWAVAGVVFRYHFRGGDGCQSSVTRVCQHQLLIIITHLSYRASLRCHGYYLLISPVWCSHTLTCTSSTREIFAYRIVSFRYRFCISFASDSDFSARDRHEHTWNMCF